ncbi:MAG: maltokinase N-terminal cap-like domain-containing protein, partial [Solirubrobacteraceae bacterium]
MTAATPSAREWAERIDLGALAAWVAERRWYGSKSRTIAGVQIDECAQLADSPPQLLTLLQVRFPPGDHELYQLPLTMVAPELAADGGAASARDLIAVDGLEQGDAAHALLAAIEAELTLPAEEGEFTFRRSPAGRALPASAPVRPAGPEQSHTSLVFGDRTVLKVLRRLEPGVSPELELLRFLGEREFPNVPALQG